MWTHLKTWLPLAVGVVLAVALVLDVTADRDAPPDPVAEIDGHPIAWEDLASLVAADLQRLESERHQVLERGLDALLEDRLLEAEAARREISTEELVKAEILDKTPTVTEADVDTWYAENQARVRQPKEQVADQIRAYLSREREQTAREALLRSVRGRFEVVRHLEPLRIELERAEAPSKGPDAPVTLVEFSDFQCPYCARITPTLAEVRERYGDKVRVEFRHFPLHQLHPQAQKAAEAALCAGDQGKFWPMHDAMFASQGRLAEADLKAKAGELGLDGALFASCLDSGAMAERVQADLDAGRRAGVTGTPTLFINGRPVQLQNGRPFTDQLADVIDDELRRVGG